MLNGLNYEDAKSSVEYFKYLEPSLAIFEEFYDYINSNGYENIIIQDYSIHGSKNGKTAQLFFDTGKYYHYGLKVWDAYNLLFIYEDGKYRLYKMDENKEFDNLSQIMEYLNSLSDTKI